MAPANARRPNNNAHAGDPYASGGALPASCTCFEAPDGVVSCSTNSIPASCFEQYQDQMVSGGGTHNTVHLEPRCAPPPHRLLTAGTARAPPLRKPLPPASSPLC